MFGNPLRYLGVGDLCSRYGLLLNRYRVKKLSKSLPQPAFINTTLKKVDYIQIQKTPNPNCLKFVFGTTVCEHNQTLDFQNVGAARDSPLALMIFNVSGVKAVFFGPHFITLTKYDDVEWKQMTPYVLATIKDFFAKGLPIVTDVKAFEDTEITGDVNLIGMIKDIIDTKIRPIAQEHGGDVQLVDFKNGVLRLKMHGTCISCPNSEDTFKNGIQNTLQFYIPEILSVEKVDDEHEKPSEGNKDFN